MLKRILPGLTFIIMFSCQEKIFTGDVDCDKCYTEKPDSADLVIYLTYNSKYDSIPLVVYRDEVGDNNIDYVDTAYGDTYYLYSRLNQKYAVKAEYADDSVTIFVIDASKLKVKRVSDACDEVCWVIEGGEMDATLKYP